MASANEGTALVGNVAASRLYVVEEDERGVRYRRATADPRGAGGAVLAAGAPPEPFGLLGSPDPFPLEWIERPPAWLEQGEGVRIALDGPETGRAAGYIRLHGSCYQDGTGACRMPPPVTYEAFHRGEAQVVDDEGRVKETAVGAIAIVGGHSSRAGARTATDAIAHIDLPEKAKLRGVLVEDAHGLLFLGAARADMTRVEASMVNQSDVSGEWWPLFERGDDGQVGLTGNDMIGIALVTGGAFRKRIPERFRVLAAALGRDLDDEEMALMTWAHTHDQLDTDDPADCGCSEPVAVMTAADLGLDLDLDFTSSELPAPADEVQVPMMAAPMDEIAELRAQLEEQQRTIETLQSDMETLQRDLMQLRASLLMEEEVDLPEQVQSQEEELRAIDRRLAQIEQQQQGIAAQQARNADTAETPAEPAGVAPGPFDANRPAQLVR